MGINSIKSIASMQAMQGSNVAAEAKAAPVQPVAAQEQTAPVEAAASSQAKDNRSQDQNFNSNPEQASDTAIRNAVDEINRKSYSTEAIFGYHEGTKRVTIKIVDKETKEIKKEYPAEKTLDMIQRVWEMAGLMVDEKR